jgi:hypothetical protein
MIDASMVDMTPYLLETFESVQRQVHFRHASFLDRITVSAFVEMLHSIDTQSFPFRAHHSISAPFPLHDIRAEDARARSGKRLREHSSEIESRPGLEALPKASSRIDITSWDAAQRYVLQPAGDSR